MEEKVVLPKQMPVLKSLQSEWVVDAANQLLQEIKDLSVTRREGLNVLTG